MQTTDATLPYIRQIQIIDGRYHSISHRDSISDFTLKIVHKDWSDAGTRRFVQFHDSNQNLLIPLEAMVKPAAFRIFCLSMGSYHWWGNQTDVDGLIMDLDHDYYSAQATAEKNRLHPTKTDDSELTALREDVRGLLMAVSSDACIRGVLVDMAINGFMSNHPECCPQNASAPAP